MKMAGQRHPAGRIAAALTWTIEIVWYLSLYWVCTFIFGTCVMMINYNAIVPREINSKL